MVLACVAPNNVLIKVETRAFNARQLAAIKRLVLQPVAITYGRVRGPGHIYAVAKSKMQILGLAESQKHPSMQALARALSDWSQTDDGIAMLNRAADLTPTDFDIGGLKRKIDTMMQDDGSSPTYKLPRTFVFQPSAQEEALLDTSAHDLIDLTALAL